MMVLKTRRRCKREDGDDTRLVNTAKIVTMGGRQTSSRL